MRGNLNLLVAVAVAVSLCGCAQSSAEGDTARASVAAGATAADTTPGTISVPAEQVARLHVEAAEQRTFRPTINTTGTVQFNADVSTPVLAPISGPVTRILAEPGATVHAGEALALVSSPDFASTVAEFRKAQATWVQAKRVADLDEQLWKNDAIAKRDLEQAQTDAEAAAADRDAALQQLRALGVDEGSLDALRDGKTVPTLQAAIRAPIGGTVVERLINPGQLLEAGSTQAFTVANLATMWVEANVFESDLSAVRVGDRAEVTTTAASDPVTGRVTYIAALVDPATKATSVRVVVPNPRRLLKKDMYVEVAIHASHERTGVLIPVTAVLRDDDNLPFVYVETPGSNGHTFGRRQITLGSRVDDRYEVTDGLKAGDRIISEGALFVQFAQTQ